MSGARDSFTSGIRTRPGRVVRLGGPGEATIAIRVQVPEVWDAIRVETPPDEPVLSVKVRALDALFPMAEFHEDFVVKLNGFEVLDENASVAEAGAVEGSIFLLTHRRRRATR
jgi:hypothetical protein